MCGKFSIEFYILGLFAALVFSACDLTAAKDEEIPAGVNKSPAGQVINSSGDKTVSETASNSVLATASLCTNKYFPVADGARKRYKVTSSKGSDEYTYTINYQTGANKFVQTQDIIRGSEAELKIDWLCLPDGLRTAKYGQLTGSPNIGMKLDSVGGTGITLPKDTDWQIGKKWTSEYDLSGTFEVKPIRGNVTGKVVLNHEILALEDKVKVAAGEFATAKVKTIINLQASFQNRRLPAESVIMTNWYAPDVGLIKQEVTGTMSSVTMDYLGQ